MAIVVSENGVPIVGFGGNEAMQKAECFLEQNPHRRLVLTSGVHFYTDGQVPPPGYVGWRPGGFGKRREFLPESPRPPSLPTLQPKIEGLRRRFEFHDNEDTDGMDQGSSTGVLRPTEG